MNQLEQNTTSEKQNKFYGYQPKENNLLKLQHYLTTKNAFKAQINAYSGKTKEHAVLKNKRF
jgi:hypothetical protein